MSNERILSGPGMELVYRALAERNGVQAPARTAAEIVSCALEDHDELCLEVLECFAGMLGGAAANLAVTLCARGGIYIGGGVVPPFRGSPAATTALVLRPLLWVITWRSAWVGRCNLNANTHVHGISILFMMRLDVVLLAAG